ncbi:ROK family protein [Nonomuraea ferruginea]
MGVGAGVILDGRLRRGGLGYSGELGHVQLDPEGPACRCGRRGCLEAMARHRRRAPPGRPVTGRDRDRAGGGRQVRAGWRRGHAGDACRRGRQAWAGACRSSPTCSTPPGGHPGRLLRGAGPVAAAAGARRGARRLHRAAGRRLRGGGLHARSRRGGAGRGGAGARLARFGKIARRNLTNHLT